MWTGEDLETVSACGVCGAPLRPLYADLRAHSEGPWKLWSCRACDAAWLSPRPTLETIGRAYAEDYSPYHQPRGLPAATTFRERATAAIRNARIADHGYALPASAPWPAWAGSLGRLDPFLTHAADRLLRSAPPPSPGGRLLDVGCSNGAYVTLMGQLGWEAYGVEMDARVAAGAREHGLSVRHGTMAELSPERDGVFDFITLGHVIEHVHDPVAGLEAVRAVLAPGGRVWIATPNMGSLSHRAFRSRWHALDPPRHLALFTRRSLELALQRAGFGDVKLAQPTAMAPWLITESALHAGIRHGATALGKTIGVLVDILTCWRWDIADELVVVACVSR